MIGSDEEDGWHGGISVCREVVDDKGLERIVRVDGVSGDSPCIYSLFAHAEAKEEQVDGFYIAVPVKQPTIL